MNEKSLSFFEEMSNDEKCNQNSLKLAKNSDFTTYDVEFIMRYANNTTNILDLGSGTGLIVNKIYDKVGRICCVDPIVKFTNYIMQSDNIEVVNKNMFRFSTKEKFDIISMFGIMHYLDENEAKCVYEKFYNNLNVGGCYIIKNQFGKCEDVIINGYSDELGKDYYANYRYIKKEVSILEDVGFTKVEVFDIYPKECNRWDNTHFYAIVAKK